MLRQQRLEQALKVNDSKDELSMVKFSVSTQSSSNSLMHLQELEIHLENPSSILT
jgi:hypothetical protein